MDSDLHVVSFDEFPSAALMGVHTLNHDPQRLGRLTADVILKRMNEPVADNYQSAVMKVSINEEIQGVA
jgi:DNA-binding LacI/PurR family transcriptional regulator